MATNREAKAAELLAHVGRNASAAAELLAMAAECLEAGEPMPGNLAAFLAASFRQAAVSEPCDERGKALAFALGLSAPGKEGRPRKRIPKGDVALTIATVGEGMSETELKKHLADAYGVSAGTALNRIQETKSELEEARRRTVEVMENNGFNNLVRRRIFDEGK